MSKTKENYLDGGSTLAPTYIPRDPFTPAPSPYCNGIIASPVHQVWGNQGLYDNNDLSKCEGVVGSGSGRFRDFQTSGFCTC